MLRRLPLALVLLVGEAADAAAPAYLVSDINSRPAAIASSFPGPFSALDGRAYFAATDPGHGTELWRSDGSADGTALVADLNSGEGDSDPRDLTAVGEALWFFAWDGRRGCGLWRSDGSESGTQLVATLPARRDECRARGWPGFAALGDGVVFGPLGTEGRELWRSDGTAAGTHLVADIQPGLVGSWPTELVSAGDAVYFAADDGTHGYELWRSDGTPQGTVLVRDIFPGENSSLAPTYGSDPWHGAPRFAVLGGVAVFAALDPVRGAILWRSDGSEAGTVPLVDDTHDLAADVLQFRDLSLSPIVPLGDGMAAVFSIDDPQFPQRLRIWRTDGTAAGTALWTEVAYDNFLTSGSPPAPVTRVGSGLAFALAAADGTSLWRLGDDGESSRVILPGDRIGGLVARGDDLLFVSAVPLEGCGVWRSDGTQGGTVVLVSPESPGGVCPNTLAEEPPGFRTQAVGDRVLFAMRSPTRGTELFASDGTASGTGLLRNINDETGRTSGVGLQLHAAVGDLLFFSTFADRFTLEPDTVGAPNGLWRSDGTAAGTVSLGGWSVSRGGAAGDRFVFNAGVDLWASDGSADGTRVIVPGGIVSGEPTSTPAGLFLNMRRQDDDSDGLELWLSDGTELGTRRVVDLTPGRTATFLSGVAFADGLAFAVSRSDGDELWYSDGTSAGTHLLSSFARRRVHALVVQSGELFAAVSPTLSLAPSQLWRSDGTAQGTQLVVDLATRSTHAGILWLAPGPTDLFLAGIDGLTGLEPWRSDGTEVGTRPILDLNPGAVRSLPVEPRAAIAGRVQVFLADDGVRGLEPWRSDGARTTLLRDIDAREPAVIDDVVAPAMLQVGNRVVFAPHDRDAGFEPWFTDGTPDGTRRLADLAPGPRSSLRLGAPFAATRTRVFFAADNGESGQELWAIRRSALGGATCAGDCDGDGSVGIAELVRGVGIALGEAIAGGCAGLDRDDDGAVSIDELIAAVATALTGC